MPLPIRTGIPARRQTVPPLAALLAMPLLAALLTAPLLAALLTVPASRATAATVTLACSAVGMEYRLCREGAQAWARETGHTVELVQSPSLSNDRLGLYLQLLAARSADVDVFQIDVIWPGILGAHLIDLRPHVPPEEIARHFPALVAADTVAGELKALPWYADAGLLFYRRDLLARHGRPVPRTWDELTATATAIVARERAAGDEALHGFVFQGRPYEGLTCNALEWIDSHGGGRLLDDAGRLALDTPGAVQALRMAAGWVGGIAPRGVLTYSEEESRGVFQAGHAVFMRNWPYAWALANAADSPVRGKVGVAPLPAGGTRGHPSATLGGWGLAVSRYSRQPALGVALARHLTSAAEQKRRAIVGAYNPTRPAVYDDPEVRAANPFFAEMPAILRHAVARPADLAGPRYNRLSATFWEAVHEVLSGQATPEDALGRAQQRLERRWRR